MVDNVTSIAVEEFVAELKKIYPQAKPKVKSDPPPKMDAWIDVEVPEDSLVDQVSEFLSHEANGILIRWGVYILATVYAPDLVEDS